MQEVIKFKPQYKEKNFSYTSIAKQKTLPADFMKRNPFLVIRMYGASKYFDVSQETISEISTLSLKEAMARDKKMAELLSTQKPEFTTVKKKFTLTEEEMSIELPLSNTEYNGIQTVEAVTSNDNIAVKAVIATNELVIVHVVKEDKKVSGNANVKVIATTENGQLIDKEFSIKF